jgi:hypothetical protein
VLLPNPGEFEFLFFGHGQGVAGGGASCTGFAAASAG